MIGFQAWIGRRWRHLCSLNRGLGIGQDWQLQLRGAAAGGVAVLLLQQLPLGA